MESSVGLLATPPIDAPEVEIVERKGLGHPDSVCDALAEEFSRALCRYYRDRFGLILHHNVDKLLLCGGSARPTFRGGEVVAPIELFFAGRATTTFEGVEVPVEELAIEGSRSWLARHLHALDVERHVRLHSLVRPGSQELAELYLRQQREGVGLANDTSCGVGYAPLSRLETLVREATDELSSLASSGARPEIGEDVKVMGVRRGNDIHLTVACAFVDRHLEDLSDYERAKARVAEAVQARARRLVGRDVDVAVNTADDLSTESIYLTVTGTSAEAGDDGEAGRGNRVNGLITPYRPMTMESVAGKNPVTHVGKLYNLAAGLTSAALVEEVPEVAAAQCMMVSQIGRPIDDPQLIDVRVRLSDARPLAEVTPLIREVVREQVKRIPTLSTVLLDSGAHTDGIAPWPPTLTPLPNRS